VERALGRQPLNRHGQRARLGHPGSWLCFRVLPVQNFLCRRQVEMRVRFGTAGPRAITDVDDRARSVALARGMRYTPDWPQCSTRPESGSRIGRSSGSRCAAEIARGTSRPVAGAPFGVASRSRRSRSSPAGTTMADASRHDTPPPSGGRSKRQSKRTQRQRIGCQVRTVTPSPPCGDVADRCATLPTTSAADPGGLGTSSISSFRYHDRSSVWASRKLAPQTRDLGVTSSTLPASANPWTSFNALHAS